MSNQRDLEQYVKERDAVAIEAATLSNEMEATLDRLTKAESERAAVSRRNLELAAEMLRLANEIAADGKTWPNSGGPADDAATHLAQLEKDMRISRRKWRLLKGTASAAVLGSGADWASDPELRHIVLDPE